MLFRSWLAGKQEAAYQAHGRMLATGRMAALFGRKLPMLFDRCGLENIRHEATAEVVRGDSPWAMWWKATFEAWRTWEQAAGTLTKLQESEYKALLAPWGDSSFWFVNVLLHACWGQRPAMSGQEKRYN